MNKKVHYQIGTAVILTRSYRVQELPYSHCNSGVWEDRLFTKRRSNITCEKCKRRFPTRRSK